MKAMRILMIAVLFTFMSSAALADDLKLVNDGEPEDVYEVTVNPEVEPFELHLVYKAPSYHYVKEIQVYRSEELLQTVRVNMVDPVDEGGNAELGLVDANFDGYGDLQLLSYRGATGNEGWLFWLYDPGRERFKYNSDLSNVPSVWFDEESKSVFASAVAGHAGRLYSAAVYEWEGMNLVLVRLESQSYDEEAGMYHRVVSVLKDGKMEVVSDEVLSGDDLDEERF